MAELAISWVLAKTPRFVPLVGVKTEQQLRDALGALDRPLAAADVVALEALVPGGAFAGDRYGSEQMKHLDSERRARRRFRQPIAAAASSAATLAVKRAGFRRIGCEMSGTRHDWSYRGLLVLLVCSACGGRVSTEPPEPSQPEQPSQPQPPSQPEPPSEPPRLPDSSVVNPPIDIGGNEYLMNVLMFNDLTLRFRLSFLGYELSTLGTEARLKGELRFENQTRNDPPISSFETVLDSSGNMLISTGRVDIPPDQSPVPGVEIVARFNFLSTVLREEFLCGRIADDLSAVEQPIQQNLKGTTFGASLIEGGVIPTNVPNSCF